MRSHPTEKFKRVPWFPPCPTVDAGSWKMTWQVWADTSTARFSSVECEGQLSQLILHSSKRNPTKQLKDVVFGSYYLMCTLCTCLCFVHFYSLYICILSAFLFLYISTLRTTISYVMSSIVHFCGEDSCTGVHEVIFYFCYCTFQMSMRRMMSILKMLYKGKWTS